MVDSKEETQSRVPAWQKARSGTVVTQSETTQSATLEQARTFLRDPVVKDDTKERKVDFLCSKGFSQEDIQKLLAEEDGPAQVLSDKMPGSSEQHSTEAEMQPTETQPEQPSRPLIITYPEFLVRSTKPSPLITLEGLLTTLYSFGALSTLIYGTSKYIFKPMADSLTEARVSLHDTANDNLSKLLAKLETVVSKIPSPKPSGSPQHAENADDVSSCGDPTELFHRDIGVQTSLPSTPARIPSPAQDVEHTAQQERKLAQLAESIRSVSRQFTAQSEDYADMGMMLDAFEEDLDELSLEAAPIRFSFYGQSAPSEPDDELKKAKDNIRRVKGALLSTRNFPGCVR